MTCNKCKQAPPREGDTWCLPCSAWEAIGVSLSGRWASAGLRGSAAEAVVNTARLLKSLRNVDAGLVARAKSEASRPKVAPVKEEEVEEPKRERSRSPLVRSRGKSVPAHPQKEEYSEGSESEELSEEEDTRSRAAGAGRPASGHLPPPEPAHPPRGREAGAAVVDESERRRRDYKKDKHGKKDKHSKEKKRRKGHRGGRKHKRLSRALENSEAPLHRSLPPEFWSQTLERRSHLSPTADR